MALPLLGSFFHVFFSITLLYLFAISSQQPVLSSHERDSVYEVLDSINAAIPWRTLFPDDLCASAPHGIVCDYFSESPNSTEPDSAHITEMSFGYVSDYTANPPCSPNSTLNPILFSSFKYLRKLFFYKCFTGAVSVSFPGNVSPTTFASSLEELVLIDNPSLVGPLSSLLGNFTNIRRVVVTGNGVHGGIPERVSDFVHLQEITLSRNRLSGQIPASLAQLKSLKILDLSRNSFNGYAPESIGNLSVLLKLDMSSNKISGKIPESYRNLKKLEFLDLSYNRFGNFGIPHFISTMPRLKEVHLSGNSLGGQIPEKWEKLNSFLGIGFSAMGLTGSIPPLIGLNLRNLSYLGLDNNKLQGNVPEELGLLEETVKEINLENNILNGRVPFSAKFSAKIGSKLKLGGNPELCVDEELKSVKNGSILGQLKLCHQPNISNPLALSGCSSLKFASTNPLLLLLLGVLWVFWVKF